MPVKEQVIVEFISDTDSLQPSIDQLVKLGAVDQKLADQFKQTNTEIKNQATALKGVSTATEPLQGDLKDLDKQTKDFVKNFVKGFESGVLSELEKAGVSMEDFIKAMKRGPVETKKASGSMKAELRAINEEIIRMKVNNQAFGQTYNDLVKKAGALKDAIGDVGQEVKNAGSDTQALDGLLGVGTGIAGVFTAGAGAVALFGEENEEMQKTLVKVQSTLAILQGLQSVQTTLQKESAAMQFLANVQTKAGIVAQTTYGFVVGKSTGALKAFRIALASTGIGLLIIAIGALVANWDRIKGVVSGVSEELKDMADTTKKAAEAEVKKLDTLTGQDNILKAQGKTEKEILDLKIKQTDEVIALREQQIKISEQTVQAQIEAEKRNKRILAGIINFITFPLNAIIKIIEVAANVLGKEIDLPDTGELASLIFDPKEVEKEGEEFRTGIKDELNKLKNDRAGYENSIKELQKKAAEQRLRDQIAIIESQLSNVEKGSEKELELIRNLIRTRARLEASGAGSEAERKAIADKTNAAILEAERTFQKARLDEQIKGLENQLINIESGSREELRIRQSILAEQLRIDLLNTELTEAQKKNIREKSLQEQLKLQADYNKKITLEALDDQISRNNAEINLVRTSSEDKLLLQIANIELAAAKEVEAANGNSAKIKEINVNREAAILQAKINAIDAAAAYEIAIRTSGNGSEARELERIKGSENRKFAVRVDAIRALTDFAIRDNDTLLDALDSKKPLISKEEYEKQFSELMDSRQKILEDGLSEEQQMEKEHAANVKETIFLALNTIADTIGMINDMKNQQDQDRIDGMKAQLKEQVDAGAITEKQAAERQRRIDAEEKKAQIAAAKRAKELAIFNAIIQTAQAVVMALGSAPPPFNFIQAGIVGAAGAAQIALIAGRPLPKFGKGKKDNYEGPAEVAETGQAEIVERDGKMYVVPKRTIMWIGEKDKVYNPTETKAILQQSTHRVNHDLMNIKPVKTEKIDYDRIGKEVGRNLKNITINIDKDGIHTEEGQSRVNYFNNRYSFKKKG